MDLLAIWSILEAEPGKEQDAEAFLRSCRSSLEQEEGTTAFYALKTGPSTYATFAAFTDEAALAAHVSGPTAKTVMASHGLFVQGPRIVQANILAAKTPHKEYFVAQEETVDVLSRDNDPGDNAVEDRAVGDPESRPDGETGDDPPPGRLSLDGDEPPIFRPR